MGDSSSNLQALAPGARVAAGHRFRGSVSADNPAARKAMREAMNAQRAADFFRTNLR